MLKGLLLMAGVSASGIIAQAVDPISGGAGWVGAGLLGAVLCWLLLKHLPDKDKQIKDLVTAKDAIAEKLVVLFHDEVHRMQDNYTASLAIVVGHCKEEMHEVNAYLHTRMHDVLNVLQTQANKIELLYRAAAKEEQ